MAKPRIIIADTDINYIIPLQLKFVEDFFENVDLEIVSDEAYFNVFFSTPQKADVLIISEELYDASLQRHNIGRIVLMTEQYEEEQTDDLNLNRIFKYTSIKEIFNEISGKSADILQITSNTIKEPQIILVYSACGGTGKTTVSLGISSCLSQNYKKVLYINASRLQSFQRMLSNPTTVSTAEVYAVLSNPTTSLFDDIKHILRKEFFTYLPPFKASLMSLGIKYTIFEKIAVSAKRSREFDYIVIDADAEFDEDMAAIIDIADKVIIVTKQNLTSVYATNILVSNMNVSESDKYIFVCNDFNKDLDNSLISPAFTPKFTISEYIEHIEHYDNMNCNDLPRNAGIQKIAYLIM